MRTMTHSHILLLLVASCAPAAYEIVRDAKPEANAQPQVVEKPTLPAPEPKPDEPISGENGGANPPQPEPTPEPIPEVQQSVSPVVLEEDFQQQGEPILCSMVTVCDRSELPRCTKRTDGLEGFVVAGGYMMVCKAGRWEVL